MSASLSSLTSSAVQSATAAASSAASSTAANALSSASSGTSSDTSLSSLSGNFSEFLKLLMTQVQNQDPSSPMDTSQFTTELVQFAGVEQQLNTNSSLSSLIQLTQGSQMLQGSAIVGKQVEMNTSTLPLQNGSASLQYTTTSAQPVSITVTDSSGQVVKNVSQQASQGSNSWTWDGTSNSGQLLPDGAYTVAVTGASATGGTTGALSFTTNGTVTGVTKDGSTLDVQLGATTTAFSNIQQVSGSASASTSSGS